MDKMRFAGLLLWCAIGVICAAGATRGAADDRLQGGFRSAPENGWTFVHLQGSPAAIGYQHGYLLSNEIEDAKRAIELSTTHDVKHSWVELRQVADKYFLPKLPTEYRQELEGMQQGLAAKGSKLDLTDLVTMNGFMEFTYYYDDMRRKDAKGAIAPSHPPEHCSAFVATGSYTKDGRIVIGHNNWTDYLTATRWDIIFDITPSSGHHFIMDGVPGLIHSADDFGINDAGILITETTIGRFHGFDKTAVPEFVRARKAMQYSGSIDDFARIMEDGNNGGYANTWLIGDRKNNEIGRLELGLKTVTLERTKDGYFVGSNFPINPKLIADETDYPANNPSEPNTVRHRRWDQLMAENKGKIDVDLGKKFETDHYDIIEKQVDPDERTICGHIDRSPRGMPGWFGPHGPAGVAEVKVADSSMAEKMSFVAGMGHPCGVEFHAAEFLKGHKEYAWQSGLLQDLKANQWALFCPRSSPETAASAGQGSR
ncbi:MAG TPA: C45 family peptidase [Bryobacteraceae bacterium]|nr:C45 family peptidase [Bryobacteraceae bacterium]